MNKNLLYQYARLIVCVGANVQKGQKVHLRCPVDCAEFGRLITKACYEVGASDVDITWSDDMCDRERWLHADKTCFETFPKWTVDKYDYYANNGSALITVYATDPENLKGVDSLLIKKYNDVRGKALDNFYNKMMSNFSPWTLASVPIKSWAKKVFPCEQDDVAMDRLWDAIFDTVRIKENIDTVAEWRKHIERLQSLAEKLNNYNFKTLHYKNALGTDFTVDLPEGHIWSGGNEKTDNGIDFVANMPTEEIFTAPKRDSANGIVFASKPLVLDGNIVDKFSLTFEDGKIVNVSAEVGLEYLLDAIHVDDGASYLGEVALVPYNSPISNSGILFYNTLFDENASCHLAFGQAYPHCIKNGTKMSNDELIANGLNSVSVMHEDFMIGTPDLCIIGITHDGTTVKVFDNGNFAL